MANPKVAPRMSDEAVKAKTGKTWAEWFAILDKAGAKKLNHRGIVALVGKYHRVGPWWEQMVTVGYERARGLRAVHEKPRGFEISSSKTVAALAARLFAAWENAKLRERWLGEAIVVRKATPHKSLRITWSDGNTNLDVAIYPKGQGKSQISVQHGKLPDAKAAERMKLYWADKLEQLRQTLES